jgi:hypothetical protein
MISYGFAKPASTAPNSPSRRSTSVAAFRWGMMTE